MIDDAQVDYTRSVTDRVLRQMEGFNKDLAETLRDLATRARAEELQHLRRVREYQHECNEDRELEERVEYEKWKAIAEMMDARRKGKAP